VRCDVLVRQKKKRMRRVSRKECEKRNESLDRGEKKEVRKGGCENIDARGVSSALIVTDFGPSVCRPATFSTLSLVCHSKPSLAGRLMTSLYMIYLIYRPVTGLTIIYCMLSGSI
jgi:hypothetical protein